MRCRELTCLLALLGASGAVMLKVPELHCDPILPAFQGCLRGQHCSRRGLCEPPFKETVPVNETKEIPPSNVTGRAPLSNDSDAAAPINSQYDRPVLPHIASDRVSTLGSKTNETNETGSHGRIVATIRVDGLCGSSHDGALCPHDECCSPYGYCGTTLSHCGAGCQSGACKFGKRPDEKTHAPKLQKKKGGEFKVVGESGVPVMHAALMPNGRVVFLDKIEDYTQLKLDTGYYAYSSEYDPRTNEVVPLAYKTNAFCAGGSFLADGRLVSVGGNADLLWIDPTVGNGFKGIRFLQRELDGHSLDGKDWDEPGQQLDSERWYPTLQILPNGHVIVMAGSLTGLDPGNPKNNNPTYEMLNAEGQPYGTSIPIEILVENQPYYMYPFIHLLRDGNLFIFAARSSELFDVRSNKTLRKYPDLVGDYRIYPNTGSSALLPLTSEKNWEPEVIVCGGGSYVDISSPTENTCGRIKPYDDNPQWDVELMPKGRTMVDSQLLPDGSILWINGCNKGAQGFGIAKDPIYDAWIYDPNKPIRERWYEAGTSEVPRLYHSVALLLLDGTVMVTGSNPVEMPVLTPNPDIPSLAYVTEFRVEIYTPPYLAGQKGRDRPSRLELSTKTLRPDGMKFKIHFVTHGHIRNELKVALYHGGFVTHSLHMGSRLLFLEHEGFESGSLGKHEVTVKMPTSGNVAPPGPYQLYVVVDGVPSVGQFVMVDMEEKYKEDEKKKPSDNTDETIPDNKKGRKSRKGKSSPKGSKGGKNKSGKGKPKEVKQRVPVLDFAKAHDMVTARLVNSTMFT